jgi:hypothetical protein
VVLAVLVAAALGIGSGALHLRTELEPEALVTADPAEARAEAALAAHFPPEPDVLLVLVRAEDMLADEPLDYLHALTRHFESEAWVASVDALTVTPLPRLVDAAPADLSALEAASPTEADLPLIEQVVATAPERFPLGLASLSELHEGRHLVVEPIARAGTDRLSATARAEARAVATRSPAAGRLVSDDRSVALVALHLAADREPAHAVEAVRAHFLEAPPPSVIRVELTGLPYVRTVLTETLRSDQRMLIALSCLGSILVLWIGFRSAAWTGLTMASVGVTLGLVTGAMGYAGEPITLLTNILPPLLVTIGIGDAVHLLVRYRDERQQHAPTVAAERTFTALATACFATSATTALGFGSLAIGRTDALQHFGWLAAGGVMVAYVVTVTFLPAALPFVPSPQAAGTPQGRAPDHGRRIIGRIAAWSVRRRALVFVIAGSILATTVAVGRHVRVDSALLDQFDPDAEVIQTTRLVEAKLGGVRRFDLVIESPRERLDDPAHLRAIASIEHALEGEDAVLGVDGPAELYEGAWALLTDDPGARDEALAADARVFALGELLGSHDHDSVRQRLSEDGRTARVTVRIADVGNRRIQALLNRAVAGVARAFPPESGVHAGTLGEAHRASRGLDRVVTDLLWSLSFAVLVIFAAMAVIFRSVPLALASIPPNVLPLAVTVAYMAARDIPLHAATVLVLPVSLGLAVDGTIHVLARRREERAAGTSASAAVIVTMEQSGRGIVLAAMTLLVGFAALSFSAFVPIRLFAELSAVAIATSVVAGLVLLPALLSIHRGRQSTLP